MSAPLSVDAILLKASPEPNTGCWLWTESDNGRGYGRISRHNRTEQAHRLFYELLVGPIEPGHELDHKCRVTYCVNPAHLDPVSHKINVQRGVTGAVNTLRQRSKTHCPRGHAYEGDNVIVRPNGARWCRECRRAADRRRRMDPARKEARRLRYHKPRKPHRAVLIAAYMREHGIATIGYGDRDLIVEIMQHMGMKPLASWRLTELRFLNTFDNSPLFEKTRLLIHSGRQRTWSRRFILREAA